MILSGAASTLGMNKEQEAIASLNGCERKLLVDWSKSLLGSMHSNVGSPGLTWKTFSKRKRSSRRPRDLISNGFKSVDELINKVAAIPEMTIAESEKHGVSVLGCRFSGNSGHVPVKKRKFMYRSPSPPPRVPSLCRNKTKRLSKSQLKAIDCTTSNSDIGKIVDAEKGIQDENLVVEENCLDENEDFSAISLLAAMACSISFGDVDKVEWVSGVEGFLVHEDPSMDNNSYSIVKSLPSKHLSSAEVSTEGTGSSISVVPAGELVASPRMDNSSMKFASQESKELNESVQDHCVVGLEDVLAKKDDEVICRDRGIPPRLHWDLNTLMETWEHPIDYLPSCSHAHVAEGTAECKKYDNCIGKMKSSQDDAVAEVVPECGDQMLCKEQFSQDMEFRLQTCVNAESAICSPEKMASSSRCINPVPALSASASTDMNKSSVSQLGSTGNSESSLASHHVARVDNVVTPKSCQSSSNCVSGAASSDATGIICIQNKAGCVSSAGEINSSGAQVENEKSADVTSSDNTAGEEHQHVTDAADMRDSSHVPANCSQVQSEQVNDVREGSLCQSDAVSLSPSSVLTFYSKVKNGHIPHAAVTNEIGHVAHEEIGQPTTSLPDTSMELSGSPPGFSSSKPCRDSSEGFVSSSGKVALEEPVENDNDSGVSHEEASVKGAGFVADYDSQYEDGEVRESIEHTWQEYDGEDMESEHSGNALYYINSGLEAGQIMKNMQSSNLQPCQSSLRGKDGSTATNTVDIRTDFKSRPEKEFKDIGIDDMRTRNGSRTNRYVDDMGGFDAEDRTRMVEPRTFRRGFIEGRTYNDGSWRKERGRYPQHGYSRGRGDHWVDYRDSNRGLRHPSSNYRGSAPFRHPGQEHNVHRRFTRYRSPNDRDDPFGLPMPMRPAGDWSPDRRVTRGRGRGRGRSMHYGMRVDERSYRGRYHGPVQGDRMEFPLKQHPSARRDRSFSPIERRRDPCIYRSNSKSSSRSRSPNPGNPCFRQRGQFSKSPNFRSEMRSQRGRSPHGSPPPPPRNTRWISERKDNAPHPRELGYNQHPSFLDRRAPARFGPRNDRLPMVDDSPRTVRPMHTGNNKFTDTEGVDRDGPSWFVTTD